GRCPAGRVPHLQRGPPGVLGRRPAPARPVRGRRQPGPWPGGPAARDPEVLGLLALLLLTDARRAARTDDTGDLVLLEEQDRTHWDQAMIADGEGLLVEALR